MARRSVNPKFLLGTLDEQINGKNEDAFDWTTNKVGGTADWMFSEMCNPACKLCGRELPLILQVYCPLEGSPYHRTLYIFGCVNRSCWNLSDSWIVLRSQKLDESTELHGTNTCDHKLSSGGWLENSDEWGEDNGNQNFSWETYKSTTESTDNQSMRMWRTTRSPNGSKHEIFQQRENVIDMDGNKLFGHVDSDGQNKNVISQDDGTYLQNLERIRNLHLNEGNGIVEGAMGIDPVDQASAEVESPDEGTITIESPIAPAQETVATLFSEPKSLPRNICPVLKAWFVSVVDEPLESTSCQFTEHERELLMQYQKDEGLNFNELFNRSLMNNTDGQLPGEVYEKTIPKHGDLLFHKMLTRLHLCPQQVLRYCRDPDATPLFISQPTAEALEPGQCSHCGENRIFELQLLPSLIGYLRIDGIDEPATEFGVVILYTCRGSCWEEGDRFHEERLIVQADPDFSYFAALSTHRPI